MRSAFHLMLSVLLVGALACDGDGVGPDEQRIGPDGGSPSLAGGAVILVIPGGALSTKVTFSAKPTSAIPGSDLFLPGSAYEIEPTGTIFSVPATLSISYDPANLPVGLEESELRLHKVVGAEWELVPNASVNTANHTVSGAVNSLSRFGARGLSVHTVEVSPESAGLEPGQTVQLAARPKASDGRVLSSRPVRWSSGDEAVAAVDNSGLVTAVSSGTTSISAMSGGRIGTAEIEVFVPVVVVDVTPSSRAVEIGGSFQLTATPRDGIGNALNRDVTWSSSDEAVATVDETGVVAGVSEGTAQVTATSSGVSGIATIRVILPGAYNCSLQAQIPESECWALVALYEATDGENWINSEYWFFHPNPCLWNGVECDGGDHTVYSLNLQSNNLSGSIPKELGNFTNLLSLNLPNNELSGSIPPELGNLPNLVGLELGGNQLTGQIPPELGNLTNLTSLHLYLNDLSGPIPPELGGLSSLRVLWLLENRLSGEIPKELGNLVNLQKLLLSFNELTGPIPETVGDLSALSQLDLRENQLSGAIPAEIGNLSEHLTTVRLSENQLSGPIPSELGNLSQLLYLTLDGNVLTGPIPGELGDLSNLTSLKLFSNELSGVVPLSVTQLGGRIQGPDPGGAGRCVLVPPGNDGITMPDNVDYRAADLDGDGKICGVTIGG